MPYVQVPFTGDIALQLHVNDQVTSISEIGSILCHACLVV